MIETVTFVYIEGKKKYTIETTRGITLREALLNAGISPYSPLTAGKNCGGLGLCATCGVWLHPPIPEPEHWHDKLALRYGYPRLSCQIKVSEPLIVEAVEGKLLWGTRKRNTFNPQKNDPEV